MKIEFFKKLWWKVLIYYAAIILLTVGLIYVILIIQVRMHIEKEILNNMNTTYDKAIRNIRDRSGTLSLKEISKEISSIRRKSGFGDFGGPGGCGGRGGPGGPGGSGESGHRGGPGGPGGSGGPGESGHPGGSGESRYPGGPGGSGGPGESRYPGGPGGSGGPGESGHPGGSGESRYPGGPGGSGGPGESRHPGGPGHPGRPGPGMSHIYVLDLTGKPVYSDENGGRHRDFDEFNEIRLSNDDFIKVKSGNTVGRTVFTDKRRMKLIMVLRPIIINDNVEGIVACLFPESAPPEIMNVVVIFFLKAMLIAVIVSSLTALFFAGTLTRPVHQMEKAAKRLAVGDFSGRINSRRQDELGVLANAFDDMTSKLETFIKSRTRMMIDISHELSTPLTTIHGTAEALIDGIIEGEEEKNLHLQNILKQVRQLSYLIDDITELSKFETGETKIEIEPFLAVDPVHIAIDTAAIVAMKKDIVINASIDNENVQVLGDSRRIVQALQNLINNAIVHNPPGTVIEVILRKEDGKVLFAVEDNGKEIPADEMKHIFERFYKVEKSRSDGAPGAGLGLAIVREILIAHDSTIYAGAAGGKKRFFFYLSAVE